VAARAIFRGFPICPIDLRRRTPRQAWACDESDTVDLCGHADRRIRPVVRGASPLTRLL
jgi:hypothetical protein